MVQLINIGEYIKKFFETHRNFFETFNKDELKKISSTFKEFTYSCEKDSLYLEQVTFLDLNQKEEKPVEPEEVLPPQSPIPETKSDTNVDNEDFDISEFL